jgi:hypothetical protein
LKPLYIRGHIDGKPVSRMLVDGSAAINLMTYTIFKKLGVIPSPISIFSKESADEKPCPNFSTSSKSSMASHISFVMDPIIHERVKEEVERLLDVVGFIRPCRYAKWVSNIVPIGKKNASKIWVCIDFRNLNKATPKDEYPMPMADMIINNASGHRVVSFLDGNVGYNQIFMGEEDMSKTVFHHPGFICLFEWVIMTFGLKNDGATYQKAMNLIFHYLLGIILEVYIDDVIVKLDSMDGHLANLRLALERMRCYGLKMNSLKCAFGVSVGKFLEFIIHEQGKEIDPTKIESINEVQPSQCKSEMQSS